LRNTGLYLSFFQTGFCEKVIYICDSHLVWLAHTIRYNYEMRCMIWDVLILGLVAATAIIAVTINPVIIDAVTKVTWILVQKQKERHIVPVSEMDAMIHAAEVPKDRQG